MTTIKFIIGLLAFIALLSVPVLIVRSIVKMHRDGWQDDRASGVGSALLELDRLVGRPSTEHKIAAENRINAPDEESGEGE